MPGICRKWDAAEYLLPRRRRWIPSPDTGLACWSVATRFARIVAEILVGLGKIARPDVMEVTEEDLVVG